jgi:uncharacterized protein (DUF1810 family)
MAHTPILNRFIAAQEGTYAQALQEIEGGRKRSHWMWFIFPQITGLGFSETSKYYAIKDLDEARAYLAHPVLGERLIEISSALLKLPGNHAGTIFGSPDDMKLSSSMTLFAALENSHSVFEAVLNKFFAGKKDHKTLELIRA